MLCFRQKTAQVCGNFPKINYIGFWSLCQLSERELLVRTALSGILFRSGEECFFSGSSRSDSFRRQGTETENRPLSPVGMGRDGEPSSVPPSPARIHCRKAKKMLLYKWYVRKVPVFRAFHFIFSKYSFQRAFFKKYFFVTFFEFICSIYFLTRSSMP